MGTGVSNVARRCGDCVVSMRPVGGPCFCARGVKQIAIARIALREARRRQILFDKERGS